MSARAQPPRRFTATWLRRIFIAQFSFYAVFLVIFIFPPDTRWYSVGFLGPASALTFWLIAGATVEMNESGVVVRNLRVRRIPWSRIREVGITRGSSAALLRFRVPYFKLDDGSVVCAQNVRSRKEGGIADAVVDAAKLEMRCAEDS